jgi:hypothetical protein
LFETFPSIELADGIGSIFCDSIVIVLQNLGRVLEKQPKQKPKTAQEMADMFVPPLQPNWQEIRKYKKNLAPTAVSTFIHYDDLIPDFKPYEIYRLFYNTGIVIVPMSIKWHTTTTQRELHMKVTHETCALTPMFWDDLNMAIIGSRKHERLSCRLGRFDMA